jgi:hypothetical protein
MIELPSWVLWLAAGAILAIMDRLLKTGYILTALGLSCIGGAAAAFSKFGLGFEAPVAITLAGIMLFYVGLRTKFQKKAGVQEDRGRNVAPLIRAMERIATKLQLFVFYFVLITLFILIAVAVVSEQKPASELFAGMATAGGILVGFVAKRYTDRNGWVVFWGSFGFVFSGPIFIILIVILRAIIHR